MGLAVEGPKLHKSYRLARAEVGMARRGFRLERPKKGSSSVCHLAASLPPSSPRSYNLGSNTKEGSKRSILSRGNMVTSWENRGEDTFDIQRSGWRSAKGTPDVKPKLRELGTKISGWEEASRMPKMFNFFAMDCKGIRDHKAFGSEVVQKITSK